MFHSSYIEISKSALQNNINFIRALIGPDITLSSVIKGNAYGHGIEQFAPLAQACGICHFSVFSADEAERLLNITTQPCTILIMGYLQDDELEWAIQHELEFYVFDLNRLRKAAEVAKRLKLQAKIHLELETGMNRTGLDPHDLTEAAALLTNEAAHVVCQGVCTHFAGAESRENSARILQQHDRFSTQINYLKSVGIQAKVQHTSCSAAMMQYPDFRLDMVRVGIMQYGFWPSPEVYDQYIAKQAFTEDPLKRLINWKSHVMCLKHVPAGDYIGYGDSFKATRDMVLAVIPVGYAWGYSRSLSNQGRVLINGKYAPVVGIVNMNVLTVDVTDMPAKPGDEVVLLGRQQNESITVASFAELTTQLNYELLTRLPLNIPRLVVE